MALAGGLTAALLLPAAGGGAETEETWDKLAACAGAHRVTAKSAETPEARKAALALAARYEAAAAAAHRTERRGSVSAARDAAREHGAANARGFSKEKPEDVEAFVAACPELPAT